MRRQSETAQCDSCADYADAVFRLLIGGAISERILNVHYSYCRIIIKGR
jgi:hypothetical protein